MIEIIQILFGIVVIAIMGYGLVDSSIILSYR